MIMFWVIAVLLTAGALLFVLPPLLQRGGPGRQGAAGLTLAVYRDQNAELEADRHAGMLNPAQYAAARSELERRLLDDMALAAGAAARGTAPGKWPAVVVALALPLLAVSLYFIVGEPRALAPDAAPPAAGKAHAVSAEQIRVMVEKLALRLSQNPDDAEGWAMLARSYNALGRFQDASLAYGKAVARIPDNASLLADYADALAMARGRRLQGEPEALIMRALKADPNHLKALALAGSAAFEKQEYGAAVRHWERIVQLAPPQSDLARSIGGSINEARRLGGTATASASAGVSGTVKLAPQLAGRVAPDDTVFIFARAAEGPRMPLAVLRRKVSELPVQFVLDDSMAMSREARLSGAPRIIVGARVSRSASATPQPGDLQGQTPPVGNSARELMVLIDQVI